MFKNEGTIQDLAVALIAMIKRLAAKGAESPHWVQPWKAALLGFFSANYPGSAPYPLWGRVNGFWYGYSEAVTGCRWFCNRKQAAAWGLWVEGTKALQVFAPKFKVYWVNETDKQGNPILDKSGKPKRKKINSIVPGIFQIRELYNLAQFPGYERIVEKLESKYNNTRQMAEFLPKSEIEEFFHKIKEDFGFTYKESGHEVAAWIPFRNILTMPDRKSFRSVDSFYHVLFHEMVHSTMNELDRPKGPSPKEEMIAELGAAYLAGIFGLQVDMEQVALYTSGWMGNAGWTEVLEDNPEEIQAAIREADKATRLLLKTAGMVAPDEKMKREQKAAYKTGIKGREMETPELEEAA